MFPIVRYLWQIYRELPGSWKEKKQIVTKMESSIRDYVSEDAYVTLDQLKNRFGEPKQIALTYINEMEAHKLSKELKKEKSIVYTVIVTAIVIVALWAGMVVTSYIDHRKNANGYAIVEIIEIDNKVTDGGEN